LIAGIFANKSFFVVPLRFFSSLFSVLRYVLRVVWVIRYESLSWVGSLGVPIWEHSMNGWNHLLFEVKDRLKEQKIKSHFRVPLISRLLEHSKSISRLGISRFQKRFLWRLTCHKIGNMTLYYHHPYTFVSIHIF